jgi:uncharacterized membrane protein
MRALVIVGALVLILASLASAENLSILEVTPPAGILPPSLDEGMLEPSEERAFAEVALPEEGLSNLAMEIQDINTGKLITGVHIRMLLENKQSGQKIDTLRFVGDTGIINTQLSPGMWFTTLRLDDLNTSGKDYYSQFEIDLTHSSNITVYIQPVGSLLGEVYDQQGNLVPGAEVKFQCIGDYGETAPTTTDSDGSFMAEWLPVGDCRVSSLKSGIVGSVVVSIAQGGVRSIQITLSQGVSSGEQDLTPHILLTLIIIIALVALVLMRGRIRRSRGVAVSEANVPIEQDGRKQDILSALDNNERSVIEHLMSKGGKDQQNRIGRELRVPKATLSRTISGLESRNLVKTEKLGRVKRVELTERFLNGR